jgi:hypothetical protein
VAGLLLPDLGLWAAPAGALPPDQISTDLQTRLSALATAEADDRDPRPVGRRADRRAPI